MWWRSRRSKIAELEAELRAHLEMATQDRISRGESPEDAARHAREDFGDLASVREATGDVWAGNWAEQFVQDLRYALRTLERTPAFTISATLTLVIGIGAAASMFAIVHGVLLEPLPYGDSGRLIDVQHQAQTPVARRIQQTPASYFTYKRLARSIESIGLYRVGSANIGGSNDPERVAAAWVTASMMPTLQVSPVLGRVFSDGEDRPGGPNLVIISEVIWRERFGASRDVLGKMLDVNSVPRQIIGVMSQGFRFPTPAVRLWLPDRLDPNGSNAGDFNFSAVARLRPHLTPDDAQRDLASVLPRMAESFPDLEPGMSTAAWLDATRLAVVVLPLRDAITGGIAQTLWLLAAAAGLVLFVACASVANLILIRADERQLEVAVRAALGAGRLRVVAQFVAESILLSGFAGLLGLAGAWAAVRALVVLGPPDIPRLTELGINAPVVWFTVIVSVLAGFIAGAVPTIHVTRSSSFAMLRDSRRTGTSGKAHHRLRATIAGLQIALALVVLAGSGLLLRTFQRLRTERPGFDGTDVTTLWMQLPITRYRDSAIARFYADLTQRVGQLPGVQAVGVTSHLPLGGGDANQRSFYSDVGASLQARQSSVQTYTVDDGYFRALHIALVAGRQLDGSDSRHELEAIVSRQAAEELWGDASGLSAVGKRLRLVAGGTWYTVVGVVTDVRDRELSSPPSPTVYFPPVPTPDSVLGQRPRRTMALVVRTSGQSGAITTSVKRIVRELDPTLPVFDVQSMSDVVHASTARLSLMLVLMGSAAMITLMLGAIGLYGVTAYVVALRTRELGLRIALGAEPKRIVMMMTRQGLSLAISGVAAGVVVFLAVARSLRTFAYGVVPSDPITIVSAAMMLLLIAGLASWWPARRVARINPADALRSD